MNVKELYCILDKAIEAGYGHAEVLFDTEARTFGYHMAVVGAAYLETEFMPDKPYLSLHEERE